MRALNLLAMLFLSAIADDSPALNELKTGNLKFSANIYKELAEKSGNFLVCPLSVEVVLALVEAGAGGETAKEIRLGLNLPDTDEKIRKAFTLISPHLNVDDDYKLLSANKIYIKNGLGLHQGFKNVANTVYNASVDEIDFTDVTAASHINKWVSEKTQGKIEDLLSSSDLDQDTRAVLINALYFHGYWSNDFNIDDTKDKPFYVTEKHEEKAKMMEQTDHFDFYEDKTLKAKFLKLPYRLSPLDMILVLPDSVDGLAELEKNIEAVLVTPPFLYEKVHVQVPRINIEQKIDFIPILQKLGVKHLFENSANLTGLLNTNERLKIGKVVQKTFIAVEEKGTTAAAATAAIPVLNSGYFERNPPPPKEFEANHPFIFIIQSPHGVLFVGRYSNPK